VEPLNSRKFCKKCGVILTRVNYRYVGIHEFSDNCADRCRCEEQEIDTSLEPPLMPEHIERTCPRCGYIWGEACAI